MKKKIIFLASLVTEERSDPELDPDPDPLVRGADPRRNSVFCNIHIWNSLFDILQHL